MKIKEVRPLSNWVLSVVADDGRIGTFDVGFYLEYEAFQDLRDPAEFMKVSNGGYFVEWECGADLSADTIEANWCAMRSEEQDISSCRNQSNCQRALHMDTIQAQLRVKHGETIAVEIPTDEEIERIAMRMHAARKACLEEILGWKVLYHPRSDVRYATTSIDPVTKERGDTHDQKSQIPAEFTFGYGTNWKVVLMWRDGDEAPPVWFRYEDGLVRAPKLETGDLF